MDFLELLKWATPTMMERWIMSFGALIGGYLSYALGGIDLEITWLFAFAVIDYITGNFAVLKHGKWQSKLAYRGIFKKLFMFFMVAICNGVDESLHVNFIRDACIIAYILNEVGSILENIDRLGYGDIIPPILRNSLKLLKDKEEEKLRRIK